MRNCPWCRSEPTFSGRFISYKEWECQVVCSHCKMAGPKRRGEDSDEAERKAEEIWDRHANKISNCVTEYRYHANCDQETGLCHFTRTFRVPNADWDETHWYVYEEGESGDFDWTTQEPYAGTKVVNVRADGPVLEILAKFDEDEDYQIPREMWVV